jgi:hypothetical protein
VDWRGLVMSPPGQGSDSVSPGEETGSVAPEEGTGSVYCLGERFSVISSS